MLTEKDLAKKIKVLAKENPRREGTDARKFFDVMSKSKTVEDYLKKMGKDKKKRRDALLWLNASTRQGYIKLAA